MSFDTASAESSYLKNCRYTYSFFRQALAYLDHGIVQRRHIQVAAIEHIEKETNCWKAQLYLGEDGIFVTGEP